MWSALSKVIVFCPWCEIQPAWSFLMQLLVSTLWCIFFFLEKLWNATYLNQGRAGMCVCVRFFLCEYLIGLSRNKVYFRIFFLFWPCFVITNIIAFDIVTNSLCFCKPLNVHVVHILHGFSGCLNREEGIAQVHTGMQFSTLWPTVNAQCLHFVQAFVQRAVGYFTVWPDRISRVPAFSRKPFHLIFFLSPHILWSGSLLLVLSPKCNLLQQDSGAHFVTYHVPPACEGLWTLLFTADVPSCLCKTDWDMVFLTCARLVRERGKWWPAELTWSCIVLRCSLVSGLRVRDNFGAPWYQKHLLHATSWLFRRNQCSW